MFISSIKYRIAMISIALILALIIPLEVVAVENNNASLSSSLDVANLPKEQSSDQYNVTGLWKTIEGETSLYVLELKQIKNAITGNITNINGLEPIDPVSGFVYPDGKIVFNRTRAGISPYVYEGIILGSGDFLVIEGKYTYGADQYLWNATMTKGGLIPE